MTIIKEEKDNKTIIFWLCVLYAYVEISNNSGLQDINTSLEDFFKGLFNIAYNYNLENLNYIKQRNYPAIDLGDINQKLAIQVTANIQREKVLDTISKFEEHELFNDYNHLQILQIVNHKVPFRKPFVTNGKYTFQADKDIRNISDLNNDLCESDVQTKNKILQFLKEKLTPLQEKHSIDETFLESITFKTLFKLISEQSELGTVLDEEHESQNNSSDLELKKERFKGFWEFISQTYSSIISTKREKIFTKIMNTFDDADKIRVQEYLKLESRKALFNNNNDPIKAIEFLKVQIISQFQLTCISVTEVEYFLYHQLYNCFVFPN